MRTARLMARCDLLVRTRSSGRGTKPRRVRCVAVGGGCVGVGSVVVMPLRLFGGFRITPHTYSHCHEALRRSQRFGGNADRLDAGERRGRDRSARAVVADRGGIASGRAGCADIASNRTSRTRIANRAPIKPSRTSRTRIANRAPIKPNRTSRTRIANRAPIKPNRTSRTRIANRAPIKPNRTSRTRIASRTPIKPSRANRTPIKPNRANRTRIASRTPIKPSRASRTRIAGRSGVAG